MQATKYLSTYYTQLKDFLGMLTTDKSLKNLFIFSLFGDLNALFHRRLASTELFAKNSWRRWTNH